ncbi:MAG TPA: RecQ family ATP-dependent DNA helicase [Abditibacteriaceae bacterium]|jgi:ATP-dependent DNA helicase RecQ
MPVAAPIAASSQHNQQDLHQALHDVFGFGEFRALQEEAVRAAVDGRDLLVVMPTGAGKSLCFQLPAAISEGVTLVVSPLVALMRDQVDALKNRTAFAQLGCAYINSLQSQEEQRFLVDQLRDGHLKLVYVAPERFRSPAFVEALRSVKIARFVVDEAHCISEWGHDFRPDYLSLKSVVDDLGRPPLLAVTATATIRVQQSIVDNLGMRDPLKLVGGFNRPNLHFSAHRCKSETERQEKLMRALPKLAQMGGSGLIYVATRKQCDEVAAIATKALATVGKRAAPYHAGMEASTRNALQSGWINGDIHVLVATNAFGMGIDKPDVRFVVHYVYPDSLESYYQEAGRAGRDGRRSRCVVLHNFADRRTREWFIENDALTPEDVQTAHAQICLRTVKDSENIVRIPRTWWAQALGWNDVKVRLTMGELERAGLIRRMGESGDETILRIERRDFPHEAFRRIRMDIEKQRDERLRRLDEMTGYCKTTLCRRRTTLAYFGDLERPQTNGFCCDNCDKPPAETSTRPTQTYNSRDRAAMPLRIDSSDIHSLLQGLDALHPKVGKARLNKLLRGSNSKDVQRFKDESCPVYAALRGASETQVGDFLERLIELGLMHQADEEEYFICTVTRAGREAWQSKSEIEVVLPNAPRSRDDFMNEGETDLFEALRTWRRGEATAMNLPPYCVLGDRALLEIARQRPQSEAALRAITGIGATKLEKYGEAILLITRGESKPSNETQSNRVLETETVTPHRAPKAAKAAAIPPAKKAVATSNEALPDTIVDTYVMLQEGLDIEEIATRRSLKSTTIWTHIERLAREQFLDENAMEVLIPSELRLRIESALAQSKPEDGLKAVYESLGGDIDYELIRCVAAWRNGQTPDDEAAS